MYSFIPSGRTSLLKRGTTPLQVQTEYAPRPYPRLTTTILDRGRVVHKVEKKLERPVQSPEEQAKIEDMMKKQHSEILSIIKETSLFSLDTRIGKPRTLRDRLAAIPGVESIYRLDNDGSFTGKRRSEQFRRVFSAIHKSINELVDIFALIPGVTMTREKGVYEVERDRLYLVSSGEKCYFVTVRRANHKIAYEKAIKKVVFGQS